MHRLRKSNKDRLTSEEKEKSGSRIYIFDDQWAKLDALAEETGKSRNQVVRDLLCDYFNSTKTGKGLKQDITISVLENLPADNDDLVEAVEAVMRTLRGETR